MAQRLCVEIEVTDLAARATWTTPHGIRDCTGPTTPCKFAADRPTTISVIAVDSVNITFRNDGDVTASAHFFVERRHSIQGRPSTPFLTQGARTTGVIGNAIDQNLITNTLVETSFFHPTSWLGVKTLPANFWVPGRMLSIRTRGAVTALNGQQTRLRIKLDGVDVIDSTGLLPNGLAGNYFETLIDILCRTDGPGGTVMAHGRSLFGIAPGITNVQMRPLQGVVLPLNTTLAMSVDQTYQWITAADPGNILAIEQAYIQVFN